MRHYLLNILAPLTIVILLLTACGERIATARAASATEPGATPAASAPLVPGTTEQTLTVNGQPRTYLLHLPPTIATTTAPFPLVLAFHGGGGQARSMQGLTKFNRLADQQGFIVVYPDALNRFWNDGQSAQYANVAAQLPDDVGFARALIDHLVATLPIDAHQVFATGMSNGAILSQRLGCELTDKIAAIAPVAGSLAAALGPTCQPSRPIPVLMIMGEADPLVPWAGGAVAGTRGQVLSVADTIAGWVSRNGCAPTPTITQEPDRDPQDGTTVRRESYGNCRNNADVTLYAVVNGGHAWPGGPQYLPERSIGKTNRDIDASALIWTFFKQHPHP